MNRWAVLALLVALTLFAPTVRAQQIFDDPTLATHPFILESAASTTTRTSNSFNTKGADCAAFVMTATCTACNVQFQLQTQQWNDSSWYNFMAPTAITTSGNYRYLLCLGATAGSSFYTAVESRKPPQNFRVVLSYGSATTATIAVTGEAW